MEKRNVISLKQVAQNAKIAEIKVWGLIRHRKIKSVFMLGETMIYADSWNNFLRENQETIKEWQQLLAHTRESRNVL